MSELRPLTHGQYGDGNAHNSAQGTFEKNEDPKTNHEHTSNLLQESTQQLATSPTLSSPSSLSVSLGPQGAHDNPTPLHSTHHASLQDEGKIGGLTVQELMTELEKQKQLLKKVKDEAESELAAALRREEAALNEKEAALKREEAALSEKEEALKREEAALREKAALEEERKKFSAVMSRLEKEGDTLRKMLHRPHGVGERL